MNKLKRISTLLLALVMTAMLAVSAYAATVVVKYRVYVYTSQLTFTQYDYSSSTTPSLTNLTVLADSSLGSGSALYHVKYVNGAVAYCIQPGVRSDDSSNYVQGSSGCWYNLPAAVQSGIALALSCGYPSAEYGTAYGDSNSSDIINAEKWAATQAVIWDLICEYRSPYDYRSWGTSPFYTCVDTSRYPTFELWYDEIVSAMQAATDIPSFAATSSRWCDTIELTKDASGNYSASVTDTNGVLSDFNFSSNSGNGITFTQRGNTLTITATAEAAKNLSTEKTYSATGSAYGIDPDEAVLCWYDSTGKYQALASYLTQTDIDYAVGQAVEGQRKWAAMTQMERNRILRKFAQILLIRRTELGELLCRENGKRLSEAEEEFDTVAALIESYCDKASHLYGVSLPNGTDLTSCHQDVIFTRYEPIGVVLPWHRQARPSSLWTSKGSLCMTVSCGWMAGQTDRPERSTGSWERIASAARTSMQSCCGSFKTKVHWWKKHTTYWMFQGCCSTA